MYTYIITYNNFETHEIPRNFLFVSFDLQLKTPKKNNLRHRQIPSRGSIRLNLHGGSARIIFGKIFGSEAFDS